MQTQVELRVDSHSVIGEGPIWDGQKQVLYWVDIMGHKLHIYDPVRDENATLDVGQPVGTVVPRASGGVMLALEHGFAAFDPDTQALTMIHDPEADLPGNRFNDGKCDPAGRFWAGTMAFEDQAGQGSLYCLDAHLSVRKMLGQISISNGIVWSLDHATMYFIDSLAYDVKAFDYDIHTGDIRNGRIAIQIPTGIGLADGMAIDSEGMLWIAQFGGSRVCRWNPATGEMLHTISLPVSKVTACAFGDNNLDTLYITSAAPADMTAEERSREPHAGGLFAIQPGWRGVPAFPFKG